MIAVLCLVVWCIAALLGFPHWWLAVTSLIVGGAAFLRAHLRSKYAVHVTVDIRHRTGPVTYRPTPTTAEQARLN